MCGICGTLDSQRSTPADVLQQEVDQMARAIAHRGPDDQNEWVDEACGIALAYRRLAIIDVSEKGRQPMTSSSGRYVLVFNGEIYNFRDIRSELESRGQRFRGQSDTEVLVESMSHWGVRTALEKTNGMFGLAVWDRKRQTVTLARDRLGEKPVYYGWHGSRLLFASELRALLARPDFNPEIDRDALATLFRFNFIPAPRSIFSKILKLPPGSLVEIAADRPGELPEPEHFWSLTDVVERGINATPPMSAEDALDSFEQLFLDSVERRMISDVPLGAFLSGGIDSSLVVAAMSRISSVPVRTFTIGFHDQAFNEANEAAAVASHLGTDHTSIEVSPEEALATIERLPALWDEPFADSSQIPTQLVAELARGQVTVALSGDGGDESFAGYPRHAFARRFSPILNHVPVGGRQAAARWLQSRDVDEWDALFKRIQPLMPQRLRFTRPGDKVIKAAGLFGLSDPLHIYRDLLSVSGDPGALLEGGGDPTTLLNQPHRWPSGMNAIQTMMYLDTAVYLPDDILVKVDRATMATSLEARVPFLDHRLVEFAWTLPDGFKIRKGRSKYLPRQLLGRYLPPSLFERPKMGFGVPLGSWLRGPLREWADDLLSTGRMREDGYLDPIVVRQMWDEHLSGSRDWKYSLWGVLIFQAWLDNFRSTPITTT